MPAATLPINTHQLFYTTWCLLRVELPTWCLLRVELPTWSLLTVSATYENRGRIAERIC